MLLNTLRAKCNLPVPFHGGNYLTDTDQKMMKKSFPRRLLLCFFVVFFATVPLLAQPAAPAPSAGNLAAVLKYIDEGWTTLGRSQTECKAVFDGRNPDNSVLYVPAEMKITPELRELETKCKIHVRNLPGPINKAGQMANEKFSPQGLLYLPNPYVVPGGFFNEMYGWDSYFIILGLLQDKQVDVARGMVDNFLFEIEHYGTVLNANRTYFLSRSQPPFLTSMIMGVHEANKKNGVDDKAWLARAYPIAAHDYEFWATGKHLAGNTGLSRYFDFGEGPGPEITDPKDSYYLDVAKHLAANPQLKQDYLVPAAQSKTPATWPRFTLAMCRGTAKDQKCGKPAEYAFTEDYYKGDRSDRESGFDITFRFGPFAGSTHHFAAVGLNSLLYKYEQDMIELAKLTGHKEDVAKWQKRSEGRKAAVDKYLWDAKSGMYFDYDTVKNARTSYNYATTFYPLWAGMASKEQAKAVAANLKKLERPHGLSTSDVESGVQWDLPYGWAPLQLLAAEGLRRYGFAEDANRLSVEWLQTIMTNFKKDGTIREKYNVVTGSSEFKATAGYQANVVGFGWTNGVFLELLSKLPESDKQKLK